MRLAERDLLPSAALEHLLHLFELFFESATILHCLDRAVEQVQIPFILILGKQLAFDCRSVHVALWQAAPALGFKGSTELIDQSAYERLAPFDHQNETVLLLVKVLDVGLAEVTAIKDEADVAVALTDRFVHHKLELTDIVDGARIQLVKKRYSVVLIHG